ncbi:glycoside hydrolase family 15 protein [Georgenia yuyongxinii]|uniref:Trehalase n=1 Tax=Georgenia yuyongxinii TaxID=2589797 RepID=A0A5B8BZP5_9MICO|nr:glycoside hydrolase family 15 protein [Georgenia yuyongxinii]QDC23794.1 glycoside hydrolase family 15 protein [Georgenia yuyongxinii]
MTGIEDYALLGDLHTAALVSREGSIDWMCVPRFDSGACFAALLDTAEAGRWLLAPAAGGPCSRRRYRGDTLVLETEWDTPTGSVRVVDFMPPRGETPHVVRLVQGVRGTVPMSGELRLRFDYGHVVPWVRNIGGAIEAVAGPDAAWLRTPAPLRGQDNRTVSEFVVRSGQTVPFVLTWAPSHLATPDPLDPEQALRDTVDFWERWSARSSATGRWRDAVQRSLIVLKALTYAPTGGIVAAVTTSLPEQPGGPRNWDYRYSWLRDATFTLQALLAAGYAEEATAWREWLLRAVAGDPGTLQIMYGLDGTRRLPETPLPWLAGYEGSTPVRTGNAAAGQFQLDVWGEVLDGLHLARQANMAADDDAWDLQVALMDHLEGHWRDPDNGLWEMRGPRRHFTHSKVMAWVAADRMARAVRESGLPGPLRRWQDLRDDIHADVLSHGYNDERGTFVQSYGGTELDASLLLIPRVGFLPGTDPRVLGTIDAIQRELTQDGLVLRYRTETADDGLPAGEGVFLACSFWLVDALHYAGRENDAIALFERLLAVRNDVGLLSEEWDPRMGRQLGNTPQAFSHFPLVVSALQLAQRRPRHSDQPMSAALPRELQPVNASSERHPAGYRRQHQAGPISHGPLMRGLRG